MNAPEDIQKRIELDRLLSAVNAYRVKGNLLAAEDACRNVLALDPDNLRAQEMLGDLLHDMGKSTEALEQYELLLQRDKSLTSVERKYAKVTLELAEREREKHEVREMLHDPDRRAEAKRSMAIALILSLVAPGFGQIYLGEFVKGGIIVGAFLLSLMVIALSPETGSLVKQTLSLMTLGRANPGNPMAPPQYPSLALIFFIGVGALSYIFSVIDVPIAAGKRERKLKEQAEAEP